MKRCVLWVGVLAALVAWAQPKEPSKGEPKSGGAVNWQSQIVKATGSGAPDLKAQNPAQARLGALKAAELDALRNLLAQVKGIQISAGKTVGEAMAKDEVKGKVEGLVRGYKVVAKRYFSDQGVEVDVEVPLGLLTDALVDLPAEKVLVKAEGEKKATGLVIDARGLSVTPALAPRLLDEGGKQLYGADYLSSETRKSSGVAAYVASLDEARKCMRAGDRPLVLKAARAQGSDLILAGDEVRKLTDGNQSYLADGRVVIVAN